ncbi:ribonuclease [uncultured Sphingomonas sp.]|uniref:ribonuclease n=1 Tax=uncultured Sphingomonas sp. TaxID=158754 RepID=UPI0025F012F4|nr:ribonuclease [uncultured Sphingomonas sp.]
MAEWLHEAGIGECRAALVEHDRIVEMAIERDDDPRPRAGAFLDTRLNKRADASGRGVVMLAGGVVARLQPVPKGLTEGAPLRVEVVREALPEAGGWKPPVVRPAAPDALPGDGPDLLARLRAAGHAVRTTTPAAGLLEQAGWSEAMEEAASGIVARPQAMLRIALTPAMTLIDVDGATSAAELARAGAGLAGAAIRRFGIAGSIGIDLPTLPDKAGRLAAAEALDAALPQPFERTGVNGFGFLQIVRRRERPSIMERIAADPVATAALALLARAERAGGHGPVTLEGHPQVIRRLAARPAWRAALAMRIGAEICLSERPDLPISAGHAIRLPS